MYRMMVPEIDSERIILNTCEDSYTSYHCHNFIELLYVLNGRAIHRMNGVTTTISKGDYLLVDYGAYHQYIQEGTEPLQILNCIFVPRLFDETLKHDHRLDDIAASNPVSFNFYALKGHPTQFTYRDHDGRIRKILEYLLKEYREKALGYQEILRSCLTGIFIAMMRQIQLPNPEVSQTDIVKSITQYVDKHFSEKIQLELFAEKYGYSLSYVSQKFKKETNLTFREYIQSVRIQKSCKLLSTTSEKVAIIAEKVGYSDVKFFTDVFKRQTGMTPRQFRKACGFWRIEEQL